MTRALMTRSLMKKSLTQALFFCTFLFASQFSQAEIIAANENYFEVKFSSTVKAPVEKLNSTLVDIAKWWNPEHSYAGKSENLTLDLTKLHCFCEKFDGGGFVRHMDIGYFQPEKMLRLLGGLGPLQSLPVDGVLDFSIKSQSAESSLLTVTYKVSGVGVGLKNWAKPVHGVIGEQFSRLKQQAEK
ncbi:ATPase [Aliikangiella coralliicola]|uniref:ATPase n=1 Tax=Aliikangiella coralliicola TaxID=2592383 RepID=A0A545UJS9_9GAMM|nr:ATPase [Aliikangiella coralliicola]TQV89719.1 ATPase [Aliikangiella coralliicola]